MGYISIGSSNSYTPNKVTPTKAVPTSFQLPTKATIEANIYVDGICIPFTQTVDVIFDPQTMESTICIPPQKIRYCSPNHYSYTGCQLCVHHSNCPDAFQSHSYLCNGYENHI